MSTIDFLHIIREFEMNSVLSEFNSLQKAEHFRILEIGAGTGAQAKFLKDRGYNITAIDVIESYYIDTQIFPVQIYDGMHIPYPDSSFDLVFTSNVLEHVEYIDIMLDEIKRVMKPNGRSIHIIPSPSCRFWGIFSHYIWLTRRVYSAVTCFVHPKGKQGVAHPKKPTTWAQFVKTIFPSMHGVRGNIWLEFYYFSQYFWLKKFKEHNFTLIRVKPSGIFYTMSNGLRELLSLDRRKYLAKFLGSACNMYVLNFYKDKQRQ